VIVRASTPVITVIMLYKPCHAIRQRPRRSSATRALAPTMLGSLESRVRCFTLASIPSAMAHGAAVKF
jgi:hypothetical protein